MKQMLWVGILLLFFGLCTVESAFCTEEYAASSGKECGYCHVAAEGGGPLTAAGVSYRDGATLRGSHAPSTTAGRLLRLLVGYVHVVFAVLWFGTILYVHLILKPAYAVRGLPVGEKLVGIVSFVVVGLTGLGLSWFRFDSWQGLVTTRFGQLLLVKVGLYLIMLATAVVVIRWLGPRLNRPVISVTLPPGTFSEESLAGYDGKDGRPAYCAWQRKVYDVTGSRLWPQGQHMKRHAAGSDLTAALPLAPHDGSVLQRFPVVGDLVAAPAPGMAPAARVFYLLAYVNLVFVLAILLVIALWRWG